MEPELKDPMGIRAVLPFLALPILEVRADGPLVRELPGVPPPRPLPAVGVRALSPVVGTGPWAPPHFVRVHQEIVRLVVSPVLAADLQVHIEGEGDSLFLHVNRAGSGSRSEHPVHCPNCFVLLSSFSWKEQGPEVLFPIVETS